MGLGDRLSSSLGNSWSRFRSVLKHKTDQVYITVIALFCAAIAGVYVFEFIQPEPELIKPDSFDIQPSISLDRKTTESEPYYRVVNDSEAWPTLAESSFKKLAEENMFDAKAVQEAAESVKGARESFSQAEASFQKGDLVAALRLAKEAERQSPGLAGVKELIRKVQEAQSAE